MPFEVSAVRSAADPLCESKLYPIQEFDTSILHTEHDERFLVTDEGIPLVAIDSWRGKREESYWYRIVWTHRKDIHAVLTSGFQLLERLNREFGTKEQCKARWINDGAFEKEFEENPQHTFENLGKVLKHQERHEVIPFSDVPVLIEKLTQEGQDPYIDYSIETSKGSLIMMCDGDEPFCGDEYQLLYILPKPLISSPSLQETFPLTLQQTHSFERDVEYFRQAFEQLYAKLCDCKIIAS